MKEVHTGLWTWGLTRLEYVLQKNIWTSLFPSVSQFLIDQSWMCVLAGFTTLFLELCFSWSLVLPVLSPTRRWWLRLAFFALAFSFHLAIFLLVGANFIQAVCVYAILFELPCGRREEEVDPRADGTAGIIAIVTDEVEHKVGLPIAGRAVAERGAAASWNMGRSIVASLCWTVWLGSLLFGESVGRFYPWTNWSLYS